MVHRPVPWCDGASTYFPCRIRRKGKMSGPASDYQPRCGQVDGRRLELRVRQLTGRPQVYVANGACATYSCSTARSWATSNTATGWSARDCSRWNRATQLSPNGGCSTRWAHPHGVSFLTTETWPWRGWNCGARADRADGQAGAAPTADLRADIPRSIGIRVAVTGPLTFRALGIAQ
jgi:hypothetical protein